VKEREEKEGEGEGGEKEREKTRVEKSMPKVARLLRKEPNNEKNGAEYSVL